MNSHLLLISAVLRAAGFRRGTPKRRSSRSRRWSRSAQTLIASWAVLGQLGGMGLLLGEAFTPQIAKADPPMAGDSDGTATSTGAGAFAIGVGASTAETVFLGCLNR